MSDQTRDAKTAEPVDVPPSPRIPGSTDDADPYDLPDERRAYA